VGCILKSIGCLVILILLAAAAFLTRDRWIDRLPGRAPAETASVTSSNWAPLSEAGAARTKDALTKLQSPRGPVFVTLGGSDVASYILLQITRQMPASADSFVARVDQDRIRLRASMKMSDLGSSIGGVLGSLMSDRERVEMSGTLRVIGPGLAEFRVTEVRVSDVALPSAVINRLVRPMVKGARPPGLDENGLAISIPPYIGDVRVANGKITLYKNVQ
jgi:hypothetical protein